MEDDCLATERGEDEDEGEDIHAAPHKPVAFDKVVLGHDDSMTLVVQGSGAKDKAQILQVTNKTCASHEFTPRQLCVKVSRELRLDGVTLPVSRDKASLDRLRGDARRLRSQFLGL